MIEPPIIEMPSPPPIYVNVSDLRAVAERLSCLEMFLTDKNGRAVSRQASLEAATSAVQAYLAARIGRYVDTTQRPHPQGALAKW